MFYNGEFAIESLKRKGYLDANVNWNAAYIHTKNDSDKFY